MKKILEVLQDGDKKIHYSSDLDLTQRPFDVIDLIYNLMFSLANSLPGEERLRIYAVIRSMTLAEVAISGDREEAIEMIKECTEGFQRDFLRYMNEYRGNGRHCYSTDISLN